MGAIPAVAQGDQREPWDRGGPRAFLSGSSAPEWGRRTGRCAQLANATPPSGAEEGMRKGANPPAFPGLPSVALGYDWDARWAG